ncbi:MAG: porin [Elusimicrobiota bacterium]|jgi:hypothetical protein
MKKLIAIAAVLGLASSMASAQVGNFKYDGKFEFHKFYNNNTTDANDNASDKEDDQDYRANIGINFDANDDVNVQVNLIKNAGANDVEFGQAYVSIPQVLKLDHKFGRMFYGEAGDIVAYYGPDAWYVSDMPYTALEGWNGVWKNDKMTVGAVFGKEVDAKNAENTDENVYGLTVNYPVNDMFNPTAYYYKHNTIAAGTDNKLNVFGVKANGKIKGVSYYAEYAMNSGEQTATVDYEGSAFIAGAAMDVELAGKWTFNAEYASGSGDDTGADDNDFYGVSENYRPGIIWGSGANSLGNLTTWNVGAKWNPDFQEKLTLSGKFLNFSPTEDAGLTYDTYGSELNVCAKWQHTENVGLKAYYAAFMFDKEYVDADAIIGDGVNNGNGTDDMAYQFGLLATVKF